MYSLGFSMLSEIRELSIRSFSIIKKMINHVNEIIALQALHSFENKEKKLFTSFFVDQLKIEDRPSIIWEIAKNILQADSKAALIVAEELLHEEISPKQIYMIPIVLDCGSYRLIERSLVALQQALIHSDEEIRLAAVRILGHLRIGDPHLELARMIEDPVPKISIEAIKSVTKRKLSTLIPLIAQQLGIKYISHAAAKSLEKFGEQAIPELMLRINVENSHLTVYYTTRTLANLEGRQAELAIIQVARHPNKLTRLSMAYQALVSDREIVRSAEYQSDVYMLILEEAKQRTLYKSFLQLSLPSYVLKEINVQYHHASLRCLYWYGVFVNPAKVLKLIGSLKKMVLGNKLWATRVAATLEVK